MSDRAFLEQELAVLRQALAGVRRAIDIQEQNGESTADLRATESRYVSQIASVQQQLAVAVNQPPPAGAGDIVSQGQRARDEGAQTVTPPPGAGDQTDTTDTGVTNADRFPVPAPGDSGTNDPVLPGRISQSLPPITANPGAAQQTVQGENSPNQAIDPRNQDDALWPTQQGGVAQPGDDAAATGGNDVRTRLNSLFGGEAGRTLPQGNALDAYASYTYSISLYLMSDADYQLMLNQKILPKGWQLLIQSAGAPASGGRLRPVDIQETQQAADGNSAALPQPQLGRNEFFELDYYIDDLVIEHFTPNRGVGSPHAVTNMSFKIFEPNGLSFLPNLYAAVQQYVKQTGGGSVGQNQVYSSQNFLMVIRFYGYDAQGNLVTVSNSRDQITSTSGQIIQETSTATIEKYIPFQFTEIKFRVQNKITEYDCRCVAVPNVVNTGQARGTIPYNIELSAQTVADVLTGPINFVGGSRGSGAGGQVTNTGDETSRLLARAPGPARERSPGAGYNPRRAQLQTNRGQTAPTSPPNTTSTPGTVGSVSTVNSSAPPTADAASRAASLTISQGLQEALNKFQAEVAAEGKYQEYPDIYEIVIAEEILAKAKVIPPDYFNPRQSAMIRAQTAKQTKDGATQSVDTNTKTIKAMAGKSIVQFIDEVLRQSTYVLEQQKYYIDRQSGNLVDNSNPSQILAWYRIGLEAEPTGFYDRIRNDKQYRLRYTVAPYQVNQIKSDYFPRAEFLGVHKVYNYWFTGENTQILNFEQSFNNLFYIVQNAPGAPKTTSNYLEADRYYYSPLNPENSQGQENMRVYDGAASAASWLYSPGDQASIKLDIVGDPAWIWQGELWSGFPKDLQTNYDAFLKDGTINPNGREIMFEVVFNQPVDYDLQTGLMDAGQFNFGTNTAARQAGVYGGTQPGKPRERYLYRARTCKSSFRQGRFVQELIGDIVTFTLEEPRTSQQEKNQDEAFRREQAVQNQTQGRPPVRPAMTGRSYTPPGGNGRGSLANRGVRRDIPPATGTLSLDDFFPTPSSGQPSLVPQQPPTAPTSSTQPVGTVNDTTTATPAANTNSAQLGVWEP